MNGIAHGSRHYHWAIAVKRLTPEKLELDVDEFWSGQLWTTKKYREIQGSPGRMKFFQVDGVPEEDWEQLSGDDEGWQ